MNSDLLPFTTKSTFIEWLKKANFCLADYQQIEKAIELAIRAHQDQKRDSGTPYLEEHIWSMGVRIIEKFHSDSQLKDILICGLLHDAVEDSKEVSIEQIRANFGEEIATAIQFLTKNKKENNDSLTENEKYEINKNYVARLSVNKLASIIKIEDRLSNLSCIVSSTVGNNVAKYQRYIRETIDVFVALAQQYPELGYEEQLSQEIDRIKLLRQFNE